jgi:DNA-binding LacI/PurR family transcriptional regulator
MGIAEPLELTTVGGDLLAVGQQSLSLLLDENALTRPKQLVLPVQLIVRKTTAPPPAGR